MSGRSLFTHAAAQEAKAGRPDDFAAAIAALDLTRCHRHEIVVALLEEFEGQGITHWRDSWPTAVNALIDKELAAFRAGKPGAQVRCISTAVSLYRGRGACVAILHYTDTAASAGMAPPASDAAAPAAGHPATPPAAAAEGRP